MNQTITIQMPTDAREQEEVWDYLVAKGVVISPRVEPKKGKYDALLAHYQQDPGLTGLGDVLSAARKEFREDFAR